MIIIITGFNVKHLGKKWGTQCFYLGKSNYYRIVENNLIK